MSKLDDKKPKTLVETLQGLLTLQNWQTQLLELAILQAKGTEEPRPRTRSAKPRLEKGRPETGQDNAEPSSE